MRWQHAEADFHEVQPLRQWHSRLVLAMPPAATLFIAVRQLVFHRPWGSPPMSNGGVVFLTVLLVAVYIRLITVRLVTDIRSGRLSVGLQGLWRKRRLLLGRYSVRHRGSVRSCSRIRRLRDPLRREAAGLYRQRQSWCPSRTERRAETAHRIRAPRGAGAKHHTIARRLPLKRQS